MIPGVRGRLVSGSFAREELLTLPGAARIPTDRRRQLAAWWRRCEAALGPAASSRAVTDVALVPLLQILGLEVTGRVNGRHVRLAAGVDPRRPLATAIGAAWGWSLSTVWRDAILDSISSDGRWCLCCNGVAFRILDSRRTWCRDYVEFDLAALAEEEAAQSMLWSLARADALQATPPTLDAAVVQSARYGIAVCRALGAGVLEALRLLIEALARGTRGRFAASVLLDHSLAVLYRLLFLLFAEARGLVPVWHPVYRDRYSLGEIVDVLVTGRPCRGLWRAIQAISRLAHTGCSAGELTVTAFNGRLFSPDHAVAFDRSRVDDAVMGRVVVSVGSTGRRDGPRARIAYRELDVEQLGAVYEQVLDYEAAPLGSAQPLVLTGDRRKASGTFYTPRAVTSHLVRRTLEPLVKGRSSAEILALKVLDPAMGSGAFLVAACRYLAGAAEAALIDEGRWHAHDVMPADRTELRRDVAARCLFGVDLNPTAVQLARLSIWLATLSAEKPLSFLDHHLVAGDSLIGAAPQDIRRQPSGSGTARRRHAPLTLFDDVELATTLRDGAMARAALAETRDETAAIVRAKERTLAGVHGRETALGRWSRVLDLWCAGWFWEGGERPDRGTFRALVDRILHDSGELSDRVARPWLDGSDRAATRQRFLHWPVAFPEVFVDSAGAPLPSPGFDAVIGNPPWDMVRGDSGDGRTRVDRRSDARRLMAFVRDSGIYRVESRAHVNRYQLFVERALQLVRPHGRVGLVLPGGVVSDSGAAGLRRHLFDHARVDEIAGLDNRDGIFPIHRSVRFVLLTCTPGEPTSEIRCRFHVTSTDDLERDVVVRDALGSGHVESGASNGPPAVLSISRRLLERLSGSDDLGVPELACATDLRLLEQISASVPRLSSSDGWGAQFGRELNATDDRHAFEPFTGDNSARPVVEGKQLEPFRVAVARSRQQLRTGSPAAARVPRRARLAYRDVASATNRMTLIAAIVPARAVTTHTLICLKTPLALEAQQVLCALLNSYVANYLVRFRVNTHVTVSLVSRLPVPVLTSRSRLFDRVATLSRALSREAGAVEEMDEHAELQALAASLYGLAAADFEHVLSTFPLVPDHVKSRAMKQLRR